MIRKVRIKVENLYTAYFSSLKFSINFMTQNYPDPKTFS